MSVHTYCRSPKYSSEIEKAEQEQVQGVAGLRLQYRITYFLTEASLSIIDGAPHPFLACSQVQQMDYPEFLKRSSVTGRCEQLFLIIVFLFWSG